MKYFTVFPAGTQHAIKVRASNEAEARLTAAIWYLTTPMRSEVTRPLTVVPAGRRQLGPCDCVNDEQLDKIREILTGLVNASGRSAVEQV